MLADFRAQHPGVAVHMVEDSSEEMLAMVRDDELDCARAATDADLPRARRPARLSGRIRGAGPRPDTRGRPVQELLVAADVSRLCDHPAEAVPYLQRILRQHPRDERAPMAAFTLGRTLSGLGRTREAMAMFGSVHSAWPHSPLAEDALVRQAEAASNRRQRYRAAPGGPV